MMDTDRIDRETLIENSVEVYLKARMDAHYPANQVEMTPSWPGKTEKTLPKNLVAVGFNFDDGGRQAECGSSLTTRVYTLEFWVFAQTATWGRNIANRIKFGADVEKIIPLLDGNGQQIDALVVLSARTERQPIPDPEPWQEFVYTTTITVEDTYVAETV